MFKKVFVDTKTTGIDPIKNGIHQIAGIIQIDNKTKEEFNFKLKPFKTDIVDKSAIDVSGVTTQLLDTYTEAIQIKFQLERLFGKYINKFNPKDKFFLIGYNVRFDYDFLREWYKKCGDKYFGSWFWFPPIDVMQLAIDYLMLDRKNMKDFKLSTVCEILSIGDSVSIQEPSFHDAMYDIKITQELYNKLKGESYE